MFKKYFDLPSREQRVRNKTKGSYERFVRAQRSLAGGVSSGLRRDSRPYPLYFSHGRGSRVTDVDSNVYIDYGLAWGPLILGHSPREVVEAVREQTGKGFTFGAQHDLEFEVAELLTCIIPCADQVSFANSGTEIVQVALRLARSVTGKKKFLKFEGHYHGWADEVLVSYHPTSRDIEAACGAPVSVGLGQRTHDHVLVASWNDRSNVERLFVGHGTEIAAVICEPMLCNSGCIPPEPGFLEFLRKITFDYGALLIFDEVITGFRLDLKGAQGFYGVTPDLATYAKAIGGGIALSALAGKVDFMKLIADGKVVHAGTLNGNAIALAAAKATVQILSRSESLYNDLRQRGSRLRSGLERLFRHHGHSVVTAGDGAVFQLSFMEQRPRNYRETLEANKTLYCDFALALLDEGILVLPDGRWYFSTAHTDEDIEATLAAVESVIS
jgi:glutamate-1-semialdehyde 2,1-aminomutase